MLILLSRRQRQIARSRRRLKSATKSSCHEFTPKNKPILAFDPRPGLDPFVVLVNVTRQIGPIKETVKKGRRTDLASVPRVLRNIPGFAPTDATYPAALFHDEGYKRQTLPRKVVDAIYEDALYWLGEPWVVYKSHYVGVRLFGWIAWNKNAKALKK